MRLFFLVDGKCRVRFLTKATLLQDNGKEEKLEALLANCGNNAVHAAFILLLLAKARGKGIEDKYESSVEKGFIEALGNKVFNPEAADDLCKLFGYTNFLTGTRGNLRRAGSKPFVDIDTQVFPPGNIVVKVKDKVTGNIVEYDTIKQLHELAATLETANGLWTGIGCVAEIAARTIELHSLRDDTLASIGSETELQTCQRYLAYHARRKDGEQDCIKLLKTFGQKFQELWNFRFRGSGDTPLIAAINSRKTVLTELLMSDPRVEINLENCFGTTPFLKACSLGDFGLATRLAKNGANIDASNKAGLCAAHELAFAANEEADLILEPLEVPSLEKISPYSDVKEEDFLASPFRAGLTRTTRDGYLPLSVAIERNFPHSGCNKMLLHVFFNLGVEGLAQKDARGHPLAYKAYKSHNLQILKRLGDFLHTPDLMWGAKLDERFGLSHWENPEEWDEKHGAYVYWVVERGDVDELRRILAEREKGDQTFDVNSGLYIMKDLPLHAAVENRDLESTRLLLGAGANPLLLNHHGRTPRDLLPPVNDGKGETRN